MPKKIENIKEYGICEDHEIMDNGQLRFRLSCSRDNTGYIRCENPGDTPEWENSHSHKELCEVVIVQTGLVVMAEYREPEVVFTAMCEGDIFKTTPGIAHNEILAPGTVIHTVKYGSCTKADWIPCPELDALTKGLTLEEAVELAG